MPESPPTKTAARQSTPGPDHLNGGRSFVNFGAVCALLTLAFALPLAQLVSFSFNSYLYSHIMLVPVASAWMVMIDRSILPVASGRAAAAAIILAIAAAAALSFGWIATPPPQLEPNHRLTWTIAAYILLLAAAGCWCLGPRLMRALTVPFAFLVFMIPMPGWLERAIEIGLQHASAEAVEILFRITGMPFLRDGLVFRLPTITLEVAQECSGIHSTLVLFITSIVAGRMFLTQGWRRWTLTFAVIPLAIVRNGVRVVVLGELCFRVGPHMIESWIHRRGGPVFFALSLIPFFLMLILLRGRTKQAPPGGSEPESP